MNLVQRKLAERINYGGIAATRAQVYADIERRFPDNPRTGIGSADWWAFSQDALTDEEAAQLIPWGIVCFYCNRGHIDEPLPDQERSMCTRCLLAEREHEGKAVPRLSKDRWHIHLRSDPNDENRDVEIRCNAKVCWAMGRTADRKAARP